MQLCTRYSSPVVVVGTAATVFGGPPGATEVSPLGTFMLAVHVGNLLGGGGPLFSGHLGALLIGRHGFALRCTWDCPAPEEPRQLK